MSLEIKSTKPEDIERIILVLNLGILNAIEQGGMSTEEAYYYFHRPFVANLINKIGGRQELVSLLNDCCMLDDVNRLAPETLPNSLREYESTTVSLLKSLPKSDKPKYWLYDLD